MVSAMLDTTLMLCSTISTVRSAGDLLDQLADAVHVFQAHALRRLVEQHQLGLHRQRGGDLQRALAAVAQLDRGQSRRSSPGRPRAAVPARGRSARRSERSGFQKWNEVPSLRCSATRTFSSTVRCGNTAEIWNERMTPRRAMCAGVSRVMSSPLKRIWPAVGVRNLVSRLKQVVLPAPLGPISAWMLPRLHLQVDLVDGDEALELLGQVARLEDDVAGSWLSLCVAWPAVAAAEALRQRARDVEHGVALLRAAVARSSAALLQADADAGHHLAGGVEHRRAEAVHAVRARLRRRCCSRARGSAPVPSAVAAAHRRAAVAGRQARRGANRPCAPRRSWKASIALPVAARWAGSRMPTLKARPSGRAPLRTAT